MTDSIFASQGFLIRTASQKNVCFFRRGADQKPLAREDGPTRVVALESDSVYYIVIKETVKLRCIKVWQLNNDGNL